MDTTKEYILMSEKAVEIQQSHLTELGDYYYHQKLKEVVIHHSLVVGHQLWLPRQDQLQGMVEDGRTFMNSINRFYQFLPHKYSLDGIAPKIFTSMEQLWLAFVMKELYSKVWSQDKGDWL